MRGDQPAVGVAWVHLAPSWEDQTALLAECAPLKRGLEVVFFGADEKMEKIRGKDHPQNMARGLHINDAMWGDGTRSQTVEIKIDDGPWQSAKIDRSRKDKYTWRFFSFDWKAPSAGEHTIISRAKDEEGRVQPEAEIKPVPEQCTVQWKVEPHFVDEFASPSVKDAATETTVTLAQGLPNTKHTLEMSGGEATPVAAILVYRPALAKKAER